jgi:hypothetical protein
MYSFSYFVGFYHLRERMNQHHFQNYLGGNTTDYEFLNSGEEKGEVCVASGSLFADP